MLNKFEWMLNKCHKFEFNISRNLHLNFCSDFPARCAWLWITRPCQSRSVVFPPVSVVIEFVFVQHVEQIVEQMLNKLLNKFPNLFNNVEQIQNHPSARAGNTIQMLQWAKLVRSHHAHVPIKCQHNCVDQCPQTWHFRLSICSTWTRSSLCWTNYG